MLRDIDSIPHGQLSRRTVLGAALGISAAAAVTGLTGVAAHADLPREIALTGIPHSLYDTIFDATVRQGFRPFWVDGHEISDEGTYLNVIFRPADGVPWIARHGMTSGHYQLEFAMQSSMGYRLANLTSYLIDDEPRYAAIWRKEPGPAWSAYHGKSTAEHAALFNSLRDRGYVPVNLSVVLNEDNDLEISGFYTQENVGSFFTRQQIGWHELSDLISENKHAGRQLKYLTAYNLASDEQYSAIFTQVAPGTGDTVFEKNVPSNEIAGVISDHVNQDTFLTRCITGFWNAGNNPHTEWDEFTGVWRRP
jgi:hypothetical protein